MVHRGAPHRSSSPFAMTDPRLRAAVERAIQDAAPRLGDLSAFLWANPETARQETKAHRELADLMEEFGFAVQRQTVAPTAFIATHSSAPSAPDARPHVVFMCEYDALPAVGHACGHNLIAECAVGAGLAVRAAMLEAGIEGRVSVMGTPAEESDGGKIDFIEAGLLADVDAALMVHPIGGTDNILDQQTCACANFTVAYAGRASHAASSPWEAVNALDAAVQAYQSAAHLRQHIRPGWRVAGVITHGGEAPNVIPERAEMAFTLRAPTLVEVRQLERRWRAGVEAAATATGCSVSVALTNRPYAELVANRRLLAAFRDNAEALAVPTVAHGKTSGSTDMGNVSHVVPAIHPTFQIGSAANCHQRDFAKDTGAAAAQPSALRQAALLALTGLDVLTRPELRREMRAEFEEWRRAQ